MRAAVAVLALVATLAATARADPREEELHAAPGSIGYGMIEQADAEGVFELVHNGQVTLRHVGSGLVCYFRRDGEGGRLLLFQGLPRGDDVACDSTDGTESVTLYATRYGDGSTVEEQMGNARAELMQRFPNARPVDTAVAEAPNGLTAAYLIARANDRLYSSITICIVDGWTIMLRYSLIAPDDAALERAALASSGIWREALENVMLSHTH